MNRQLFRFPKNVSLRFGDYSLRTKLLVAFVGVTILATGVLAGYVYISTNIILQQGLERELTQHTQGIADQISALLDDQINTMTILSLNEGLQQTIEEQNNAYDGQSSAVIQATLEARDAQWRSADTANNNNAPLVRKYLNNEAAFSLKEFQKNFPNYVEVFVTDKYGGQAGTTDRTSDYLQSDEAWWQAAYNNGQGAVYVSEPEYDESAKTFAVLIALPLYNDEGKIVGILRSTYQLSALNSILQEVVGKTGETDIIIPGETTSHFHKGDYTPFTPEEYEAVQAVADQGMAELSYEGVPSVVVQIPVKSFAGYQVVDKLGWVILFHQGQDEAFAPVNEQTRGTFFVTGIVLLLAVAAAFGLSVLLVRPITQLTQTAEKVSAGNLDSRAIVTSTDEIGVLASTFNSMTSQLQETLQGLEDRVAARTKDLATVAEVGTATATILESKRLLQEVVELTKERFNLYHSHIYLLDEKGGNLILTAGAGEPGRIMTMEGRSIPLSREQSLVARAARERKGVTVNDVTQAPDFLPNPLLPDTRSELAVPMIVGGKVIGVFDIQSEQVGRFGESDVAIQTTLAAQLAVSIQNVHSFERSKREAELQSLVNVIGSRIQRTTSIEETLQTAIRELGTAIGASRVSTTIKVQADEASAGRN